MCRRCSVVLHAEGADVPYHYQVKVTADLCWRACHQPYDVVFLCLCTLCESFVSQHVWLAVTAPAPDRRPLRWAWFQHDFAATPRLPGFIFNARDAAIETGAAVRLLHCRRGFGRLLDTPGYGHSRSATLPGWSRAHHVDRGRHARQASEALTPAPATAAAAAACSP